MPNRAFHLLLPLLIIAVIAQIGVAHFLMTKQVALQPQPKIVPTNAHLLPTEGKVQRFGAFTLKPSVSELETAIDHKLDIVAWFQKWDEPFTSDKLKTFCTQNYLPEITWEAWRGEAKPMRDPYPLADIAAGRFDQHITDRLQELTATCGNNKVIIRFNHEMDTRPGKVDWYPWQGNPTHYVAAWRHVVELGRSINPNIKWLWNPNRGTQYTAPYYPGDAWVDYVGLTLNNPYEPGKKRESFAAFYGAQQKVIESFNKPILIGETASNEAHPGFRQKWVSDLFAYLQTNPRILGVVWFDTLHPQGHKHIDYRITSTPESTQAFRDALNQLQPERTR